MKAFNPAYRPAHLRLSYHAVERWLQRWRPGVPRKVARAELEAQRPAAAFVEIDGKTFIYRTPIGALLVVEPSGIVKTVLPMGARKPNRRPRR